ncbi:8-amino-7-oxononanoate synthase [Pseudoteredinibacter isoporae]|uniref:8-amino-7-oxononanoate synthase n=1 Tax=Pseudoteredinibacter isoporae TaxID=570281 RepID=UPI00310B3E7A
MSVLLHRLNQKLEERREQQLYRKRLNLDSPQGAEIQMGDKTLLNFSSNDYLGLANHPALIARAKHSFEQFGFGAGASHLVCGHSDLHGELERRLAEFTARDRALCFSSGFAANLAVQQVLLAKGDAVFHDRLNHASLLDGAQLSGARLLRFSHNDVSHLQQRLNSTTAAGKLIAVDAVYSMDGDLAPLKRLADIAREDGALLLADDAHGFAVLGEHGAGSAEYWGLSQDELPILMGTLGKAMGSYGAFIAGSEALIEGLIQFARPYIYTTALPPSVAAASLAALDIVQGEPERRRKLMDLIAYFRARARDLGLPLMSSPTAIQPLLLGDAGLALDTANALRKHGIFLAAIRPPTVPQNSARLRITLTAAHERAHVDHLLNMLDQNVPDSVRQQ